MIEYEGRVFRPPSEAYSLIVQVTIGCSHNKCTFCDMYKEKRFRVRKLEEVKADFDEARRMYRRVGRIFLADGDALMCRPEHRYLHCGSRLAGAERGARHQDRRSALPHEAGVHWPADPAV